MLEGHVVSWTAHPKIRACVTSGLVQAPNEDASEALLLPSERMVKGTVWIPLQVVGWLAFADLARKSAVRGFGEQSCCVALTTGVFARGAKRRHVVP
eukprot:1227359-Amphidinium_carterae.1